MADAKASGQVDLLPGGNPNDAKTLPSLKQGRNPRIVIATKPTELIVTEGEPNYVPIEGTELLYVKNTTGNVFRHTRDQKLYVLVSGRWFRSATQEGPWEYVANDALPPDFAKIPDESEKENVKAAVAGTPQAKEAVISNLIPQTAEVKVADAKMDPPKYDGEPKLVPIEGTPLHYAANTATPVIQVSPTSWYAVENGVWFTSAAAAGPWAVATSVPSVIYTIPPSSPVHYVTYVRVYQATPTTVYRRLHARLLRHGRLERHGRLRHRLRLSPVRRLDRLVRAADHLRLRRRRHLHAVDRLDLRLRLRLELGLGDGGLGLGCLPLVGARGLRLLLPLPLLPPAVLGRRGLGPVGRRRRLGPGRLGGHHRQRLQPLGRDERGDAPLGRLQRLDGRRLAELRRHVLQLAHRQPLRRPALRGRQRLHRQLRLRRPRRVGQHGDGRLGERRARDRRATSTPATRPRPGASRGRPGAASRARRDGPAASRAASRAWATTSTPARTATSTSATRAAAGSSSSRAAGAGRASRTGRAPARSTRSSARARTARSGPGGYDQARTSGYGQGYRSAGGGGWGGGGCAGGRRAEALSAVSGRGGTSPADRNGHQHAVERLRAVGHRARARSRRAPRASARRRRRKASRGQGHPCSRCGSHNLRRPRRSWPPRL